VGSAVLFCVLVAALWVGPGCLSRPVTPTVLPTNTSPVQTPTATVTPTLSSTQTPLFQTYAYGEILPDMRVPIQRGATGEGGWYVAIGTEEGWKQFLAQMGQPDEIWQPVEWDEEILIGAMLGTRQGRGYKITISDLSIDGVSVIADVAFQDPPPGQITSSWTTYPFHFVRVPRAELPLGPVAFRFVTDGESLASGVADMIDLDILWLPGPKSIYPTPTPLASTSTPVPSPTPTPVPNLRILGTVLEVLAATMTVRIVPAGGDWVQVDLLEATSIFDQAGQPATLASIVPGTTIGVLGYAGDGGSIRAAHIDIVRSPGDLERFAEYQPRSVALSTIYDGYRLPLSTGTSGGSTSISSTIPLTQLLTPTQTNVLTRNGFVIVPPEQRSFAALYGDDEYVDMPIFISTDSALHITQLLLDQVFRSVESTHLELELGMLDREMFDLSWSQYEGMQAAVTPAAQRMAATALRNAAYFAVPLALLDPTFSPPDVISDVVNAELALIDAGQVITVSPLLDMPGMRDEEKQRLDYSQFAAGSGYDRAIAWHRLVAFRPDQREELRCAALIAYTFQTQPVPRVLWQRVHTVLSFTHGQDASFTPAEYGALVDKVWGEGLDITALADEAQMDALAQSIRALPLPDNPMWTIWSSKQPIDRVLRFLSPPFHIDSYIFGQMTGGYVGDVEDVRKLPSCIDLAEVLGSLEAYRVASLTGDANYANYVDQVDKVRNELSALRTVHWTEDLYWNWLYIYRALLQEKNASYPVWMRTTAWKRRDLQGTFGSWTLARQDEPGAATAAPGPGEAVVAPWGYVEPQPEVYARLAALVQMALDGLDSRLMLSAADRDALSELVQWLILLQDTARRELTSQALTDREYQHLAEYGSLVQKITLLASGLEPDGEAQSVDAAYDEATATTLASAQDVVRIEAMGRVDTIYVVVERNRQQYLVRGGVFSHYEFDRAVGEPLDDAAWRQMLDAGQQPERPVWVKGLVIAR
jgi:hypothetical protein